MKIKKYLLFFLISIFTFTQSPQAIVSSNVYTQGVYDISEANPFRATARLTKADGVTSLSIVDIGGNQKFYNRFDTLNEVVSLGLINNADLIAIVGKGEIALTFSK